MRIIKDIGRFLLMLKGMFSRPENGKMYWKEFMHQCNDIGIGSLGIVTIISFLSVLYLPCKQPTSLYLPCFPIRS